MANLGYKHRWMRIAKDILFSAVALWLIARGGFLGKLLGLFGVFYYGRDAFRQAESLRQEKSFEARENRQTRENSEEKITITDLSDTKEVDYEKE